MTLLNAEGPWQPKDDTVECDLCGHIMTAIMCKLVCENCGRKIDCSDIE